MSIAAGPWSSDGSAVPGTTSWAPSTTSLPPDQPRPPRQHGRPDDVTDAEVIDTLLDALNVLL